ncbi:calnexin-like protein precursor [Iris pallida]|uniref:Calnexin-like protein n=1 Tax=Iris pallida TaxID=29817 RepID=A0AAX6H6D5_IRIPA|nr:calnexin-like protein precursor [Iris pallida]
MASTQRLVGVPCHRPPSRSNSSSITINLIISNRPSRHGLQRPPLEHSLLQFLSMGDCLQPRLQRSSSITTTTCTSSLTKTVMKPPLCYRLIR